MSDQIDIKVSEGLVRSIIESKVQAAIVDALSEDRDIVERVVSAALMSKVDKDGNRSKYSSDNKFTYLDALCRTTIMRAARAAVEQWAEQRQAALEKEFLKQLQTKKTSNALVRACVEGMTNAASSKWRFTLDITE